MYSGDIFGVGPRYCPSIEDKINRFKDRNSHRLILEPEWADSDQIYLNGFSTSLPEKTQLDALKQIKGLERVSIIRPGYAIEYDYFFQTNLKGPWKQRLVVVCILQGKSTGHLAMKRRQYRG